MRKVRTQSMPQTPSHARPGTLPESLKVVPVTDDGANIYMVSRDNLLRYLQQISVGSRTGHRPGHPLRR